MIFRCVKSTVKIQDLHLFKSKIILLMLKDFRKKILIFYINNFKTLFIFNLIIILLFYLLQQK